MLTVEQLAARLGISRCMVSRYAKAGRIAGAEKFGRAWMFPDDARVTPRLARFNKLTNPPSIPPA